ncbi:MAG: sigma-70 family RNA polymerase sigma factor [Bacteroidales bacterium]|nr:sigma-70 family RNA polymerase sigma factor [Bacteroidales bacterium]
MELEHDHLTEKAKRDLKLIERALKDNDQAAYAELLSLYKDSVYYLMYKMTGDHNDAYDLTIEAFGKAFRYLRQYSTQYAFSTWLYKIASNNAIDYIRRKKFYYTSLDEEKEDEEQMFIRHTLKDTCPNPEELFIKKQRKKLVKKILEQLKPDYREIIELRFYNELSYEEIAEYLNIPIGTVKAKLFRARELLYQILKNKNI